jgi:hypothetical protein
MKFIGCNRNRDRSSDISSDENGKVSNGFDTRVMLEQTSSAFCDPIDSFQRVVRSSFLINLVINWLFLANR